MKQHIPMSELSTYVPLDPGEIEDVIYELKREFAEEFREYVMRGEMRSYGIAPRLKGALHARADQRVKQIRGMGFLFVIWPPGSMSTRSDTNEIAKGWASLTTADDSLVAAIATAWCCLDGFERAWHAGYSDDDAPVADSPDWERLRLALIEVAHWIIAAEYIDQEKWLARAEALEQENARLRPMAERGSKFSRGRRRGSTAPHTQFITEVLRDNPSLETKEILRKLEDEAMSDDCPIEFDSGQLFIRRTGKKIANPVNLIDKVRASLRSAV